MTTTFAEAVREFEAVQTRYMDYGASDTEPSTEFAYLVRCLYEGREVQVPRTIRDWQLFSGMKSGEAARALTKAARRVVEVGRKDRLGLARYVREELWRA